MSATHRQGLGPVVGDLFLDSDVPACERVTVSRNGWSAEVTHLWTGHGWTRLVPGPVHHVPAQPPVTRSTQPPVSSPVGTRKRSSKKAAPPALLQPPARRVPVRQVRAAEPDRPAVGAPAPAEAAEPVPSVLDADAPGAPAADAGQQAPVVLVAPVDDPGPTGAGAAPVAAEPPVERVPEPVDVTLPPTPVLPRQPPTPAPGASGARRPVRHAARR